jgi:hypothetical protein
MELLCLLVGAPQGAPLCIHPMQLRSLCVTECLGVAEADATLASTPTMFRPFTIAGSPAAPDHHLRLTFECLLCLTGTPRPFSAERRTIFCMSPAGRSRHRHPKAHIPPRRVTPTRCIRRRDGGNVAWETGEGKMRCEYFPIICYATRHRPAAATFSPLDRIRPV